MDSVSEVLSAWSSLKLWSDSSTGDLIVCLGCLLDDGLGCS